MHRRLFVTLSVLSLVLSAAALMLWGRGRFVDDTFGIGRQVFDGTVTQYRVVEIGSGRNTLGIAYRIGVVPIFGDAKLPTPEVSWQSGLHHSNPAKETMPYWARDAFYSGEASWHDWNNFIARHDKASDVEKSWAVGVPNWFVVVLTLVIPLAYVVGQRRRKYRRRGAVCEKCGYSLQGNVSGVCPECGTKTNRSGAVANK